MVFMKIVPILSENHTKSVSINDKLLIVEAGQTYSHHCTLKG
jgi:hypothetical protein